MDRDEIVGLVWRSGVKAEAYVSLAAVLRQATDQRGLHPPNPCALVRSDGYFYVC
jgi:hypothetical protein